MSANDGHTAWNNLSLSIFVHTRSMTNCSRSLSFLTTGMPMLISEVLDPLNTDMQTSAEKCTSFQGVQNSASDLFVLYAQEVQDFTANLA